MNTYINNVICEIVENGIKIIKKQGYINAGNNGPYHCKETPVRNSAHWIVLLASLYERTENLAYIVCG